MGLRRSLLMLGKSVDVGPRPDNYIKDGLVFHLDGINKGNNPAAWTDLIKGIPFTYHNCIININNVQFKNKDSYAQYVDKDKQLLFNENTHTIEICCSAINFIGSSMCLWNTYNQGDFSVQFIPNTGAGARGIQYNTTPKNGRAIVPFIEGPDRFITLSISNKYLIIDSNKKYQWTTFSGSGLNADNIISIANRANNQFMGKVHSIRVYNRILSDGEIEQNQQIDINRFT